jgi:flavodoxin
MKSAVIYSTRSGNTEKLAQTIYDALNGKKEIFSIQEVAPLDDDYDLVFVGFPVMAGRVEPRAARFLSGFDKKTKIFLFATHGSFRESELVKNVMAQAVSLIKTVKVTGIFTCQGEVVPKVLKKLRMSNRPPAWLDEGDLAKGHPDEEDIEALTTLIRKLNS